MDDMNVASLAGVSAPIDFSQPYSASTLAGKTMVITGGASGIGAAIARAWARHGAHITIGDVDDARGEALVADLRCATNSPHHHFVHCDVRRWDHQVALFRLAAQRSPTRAIHGVVPAAALPDKAGSAIDRPAADLDTSSAPAPPDLRALDVNLTGVLYTVHLATFYLPRNGGDRHILLIGSVAGVTAYAVHPGYTASKHALMGLFRALRGRLWRTHRTRLNIVCPYFCKTPMIPPVARMAAAGGALGDMDSVVDVSTRLAADRAIVGRGAVVGPRVRVGREDALDVVGLDDDAPDVVGLDEEMDGAGPGRPVSAWELYAHDYELTEVVVWRYVRLLNRLMQIRGWLGFWTDIWANVKVMVRGEP